MTVSAELKNITLRRTGIECKKIFAVCEVMEQGLLNSPIAAYSNVENARSVAARNSNDQRSYAVVEVPFFMEDSE